MSKKNKVSIRKNFFDNAAIHSYEEVTKIILRQENLTSDWILSNDFDWDSLTQHV